MNLLSTIGGSGLLLVYLYYESALQSTKFRVVERGVLGLGLILVYLYYEFVFQSRRLRVVYVMDLWSKVGSLGLFKREY
jgi:hypothetical protein